LRYLFTDTSIGATSQLIQLDALQTQNTKSAASFFKK